MKNVLIIDCGLKPAWTKKTADTLAGLLEREGSFIIDRIDLRDEDVQPCIGCALCLDRGEEKCKSHSDSAAKILAKMERADGIITVTPNYSINVPWHLKNLYDRLSFIFHRPRLFHKVSMAVVVQGVYGGKGVVKYIDELMSFWGCSTVKGAVATGGVYANSRLSDAFLNKNSKALNNAASRFSKAVTSFKPKHPSLFRLAIFRATRTGMKYSPDVLPADKAYFTDKGWLESKYFYKVGLLPLHAAFGALIDFMVKGMIKKDLKKLTTKENIKK